MVRKDDGFSFGHLPLRWLKNIKVSVSYRKAIRYICLELMKESSLEMHVWTSSGCRRLGGGPRDRVLGKTVFKALAEGKVLPERASRKAEG